MFAAVFIEAMLKGYGTMALVFVVLTPLELLCARGVQPLAKRTIGLGFWVAAIPVTALLATSLAWLWATLGVTPLFGTQTAQAWGVPGAAATIVGLVLSLLIGDFLGYWYHRAQHRWFWRLHAVHHSIRDLSAVNSYHHVGDALLTTLFVTVPTSLLIGHVDIGVGVVTLLLWLQPVFLHSPTTLHLGPLRHIIADNRYHRIHHSMEPHHFDRNFAILFSFWDRLFGTAHDPLPDEWPEVGLAQIDQPYSMREWLDLPLRYPRADPASDHDKEAGKAIQIAS